MIDPISYLKQVAFMRAKTLIAINLKELRLEWFYLLTINFHHKVSNLSVNLVAYLYRKIIMYCRTGKVHDCGYFAHTRTSIALTNLAHAIFWVHSYTSHHSR